MRSRKIIASLGILVILLCGFFVPITASSADQIISKEDFQTIQLDNDTLYVKAQQGELINNQHTKVTKYLVNDGQDQIVEIEKLLTRTIFNDGSKEEKHLREAIITPMATLEKTGTASNYSVRLRVGANYDVVYVGSVDYFKVTKFWAAGTLLDGQCRMTRLTGWCHARGPGSDSYPVYNDSYLTPVNNPVNNQTYSKYTGFTRYVDPDGLNEVFVQSTLTYTRGSGTYNYTLRMDIN